MARSWRTWLDFLLDDWTLLKAVNVEDAPGFPGWFVPSFQVWDKASDMPLTCKFLEQASDEAGTAVYLAEVLGSHDYICGAVLLRKVPACLVFNCALSLDTDNQTFEAAYTTLAGNTMLRAQDVLPGVLTLDHLLDYILDTAENNRALQSRNQSIRLLLNNEATELPPEAVLWCAASPLGWLQRRE